MIYESRRKLLFAFGASALAVISLLAYMSWSGYQQAIQAAEVTTRNYAAIMEARLDATLRRTDAHLQDLVRTIPLAALSTAAISRYARELDVEFRVHLANFPELAGMRITDANGERLYTSDGIDVPRTQLADRDYFRMVRDDPGAGLVFSEVIISRVGGKPSVVAARALRDGQGAFRGVVFAVIELSYFQKLFQSLDLGAGGIAAFYRSGDFSQVVRWPLVDENLNIRLPPDSLTRKALAPGVKTATLAFTSRRDGIARIYGYHVLDSYPFFTAVGVARDEVLAAWRARTLAVGLTGLLLLGLLAGLLMRLWRAEARQAHATAALVQSEGRFRTLFDRASDGILLVSPNGKFIATNESFARMHGYTTEELQTLDLQKLDTPETFRFVPERMRRILAGESLTFEVEHFHKDGHAFPLEVSASLISSGGEPLVQAFHRDITARVRVERELQHKTEVAQLLEQLARAANEAVSPEAAMAGCLRLICGQGKWALGRVAMFPPGIGARRSTHSYWYCADPARFASFMRASESFKHMPGVGFFIGEVLRTRSPVWLPDLTVLDHQRIFRSVKAVEAGLKAAFAFPVIVGGEIAAFLEFFATEVRQPDALFVQGTSGLASQFSAMIERSTAHEARARLAAIVESSDDAIIGRSLDGTVTSWNAAAERILGYTAAEAIGRTMVEIQPPESRQKSAELVKQLQSGQAVARQEMVRIAKDGRRINVEISGFPIKDSIGRVISTAGVLRDITERKRLEEMHLQAQKLESLGTLAGGIAHDFNNILAAIRGNADLASEDVGPDHIATQSLEEIRKAATRASELVRRIMAFGRPKEAKQEVVDLSAVVGEVLKLLRSTLPAGISLRTDFAKDTPLVLADAGQVHEAIVNLTTNAAYAIDGRSGSIEYRLEPVQVEEDVAGSIPGLKPGRYARLTVKDSGCGMDAATLERIFDVFYTTKPVGEGTGLGLSMVHGILRSHGGAVTVESAPGVGSSFHLYFPAAEESLVKEDASVPGQSLSAAGQRVLYVDDEEALVLLAERFLSRLGHRIYGFTDPEAALETFRAHPQDYDVLVTDLSMPGMSGVELSRAVLAVRPGMPVLMTTGYVRAEDEVTARDVGIRELVLKPTTMDELASVLDRLFRADELNP